MELNSIGAIGRYLEPKSNVTKKTFVFTKFSSKNNLLASMIGHIPTRDGDDSYYSLISERS